jgi:hypothetical protein
MIVLDTGGLYAAIDANEKLHERCVAALLAARPPRAGTRFTSSLAHELSVLRPLADIAPGRYMLRRS